MRKIKRSISRLIQGLVVYKHRLMGAKIGANCFISMGAWIDDRRGKVIIGDKVTITKGAKILSHDATAPRLKKKISKGVTRLDNNVFIGMNAVILSGVHIHEHSIVGAGSVVSKDIPPYCVVVGNPMKIIKKYNIDTGEWLPVYD